MNRTTLKVIGCFFGTMLLLTVFSGITASFTTPIVNEADIRSQALTHNIVSAGHIEPLSEILVFGEEGYRIQDILVKEGDIVKAGDVLIKLDEEAIKNDYELASLELKRLKTVSKRPVVTNEGYQENLTTLEYLEKEYKRLLEQENKNYTDKETEAKAYEEAKKIFEDTYLNDEITKQFIMLLPEQYGLLERYIEEKSTLETTRFNYDALCDRQTILELERKNQIDQLMLVDPWQAVQLRERFQKEKEIEDATIKRQKTEYDFLKKQFAALEKIVDMQAELAPYLTKEMIGKYDYLMTLKKRHESYVQDEYRLTLEQANTNKAFEEKRVVLERQIEVEKNRLQEEKLLQQNALEMEALQQAATIEYEDQIRSIDVAIQEIKMKNLTQLMTTKGELRAPEDGRIRRIYGEQQQMCTGQPILQMSNPKQGYRFIGEVTKESEEWLDVGDKITLETKGGTFIAKDIMVKKIDMDKEDQEKIRITAYLDGNFETQLGKQVIGKLVEVTPIYQTCIPIEALRYDDAPYVLVARPTQEVMGEVVYAEKVQVMALDQNEKEVAIEGALQRGDLVIKSSTKPIRHGDRIRITP